MYIVIATHKKLMYEKYFQAASKKTTNHELLVKYSGILISFLHRCSETNIILRVVIELNNVKS